MRSPKCGGCGIFGHWAIPIVLILLIFLHFLNLLPFIHPLNISITQNTQFLSITTRMFQSTRYFLFYHKTHLLIVFPSAASSADLYMAPHLKNLTNQRTLSSHTVHNLHILAQPLSLSYSMGILPATMAHHQDYMFVLSPYSNPFFHVLFYSFFFYPSSPFHYIQISHHNLHIPHSFDLNLLLFHLLLSYLFSYHLSALILQYSDASTSLITCTALLMNANPFLNARSFQQTLNQLILFLMGFDHTLLSKNTSNTQLLTLLTRRQTRSLVNFKNDWPGKHAPSLANIKHNKNMQKSVGIDFNLRKQQAEQKNREIFSKRSPRKSRSTAPISLVKQNSNSISLRPTPRTSNLSMNSTWKTATNLKKFYNTSKFSNKEEQDKKAATHSHFKNNRIINIINTPPPSAKRQAVMEVLEEHPQPSPKTIVNNYIVDYAAFNFLDKVIDDPEKWVRFVHKKNMSSKNKKIDQKS